MGRHIRRVVCAMSGGVDSSVAALLLKRRGYEVLGFFMRNWDVRDEQGVCRADQDAEDAAWVCHQLQIPFQEVNFVKEYWNEVFSEMIRDYETGFTPNPDILCNRHIKFTALYEHARHAVGADALATGHYARTSAGEDLTEAKERSVRLLRAVDRHKDQTFFLSQVPQKALRRTMFPLGEFTKDVVKKVARSAGLQRIAAKKESMGICFIGKRDFGEFIAQYVDPRPGNFVDLETREVVGRHNGIHQWTIGQRCNIAGLRDAYFVVEKLADSGDILVAPGPRPPGTVLVDRAGRPAALDPQSARRPLQPGHARLPVQVPAHRVAGAMHRHQSRAQPLAPRAQRRPPDVSLVQPLRALTPGQFGVFYRGDECLGSARITRPGPSQYALDVDSCRTKRHER
ncbi:LOW QUALITY PROTEIN: mitochondrial tRNA-specific 2-thiouridylase 1-like [Pollicipes pollicipes]|uniref:LOW QUALITY PROTEIN: mitochondrial tRNA-specific 2-thiouridylase 1-like n=1 Tax=Pollicipes pollicipes TaxID=41117 RepID=UPI0018857F4F|nr:LOW QUALITY PROTEIN: mitochondrial tRNA-specific 2-thiouridylase 1-like [Pollicipes pollicipes]